MKRFIALLLLPVLFTGCGIFKSHHSDARPKSTATARGDRWMLASIDSELAREQRGEHPSGGKKTWREFWEWRISLWRKEKHKNFEQYLSTRRKQLGLKRIGAL